METKQITIGQLKTLLDKTGITSAFIADQIGMNKETMRWKIHKLNEFSVEEAEKVRKVLTECVNQINSEIV